MARSASTDYARDGEGNVVMRTYEIPYRPQYVLTFPAGEFGADAKPIPVGAWSENQHGFRFHLSDEALKLVAEQGADPEGGFARLEVVWDAMSADFVMLKATQGVTVEQMERETVTAG